MSPRVSSRLAAKAMSTQTSDKENPPEQLSSPPPTPAPLKGKAAARKKATPSKQTPATKSGSKANVAPLTPKSTKKTTPASKKVAKTEDPKVLGNEDVPSTPPKSNTKRKRDLPTPKTEEDDEELPHNMGRRVSAKPKAKAGGDGNVQVSPKKTRTPRSVKKDEQAEDAKEIVEGDEGPPKKKARKAKKKAKEAKKENEYHLTTGETPFPDWQHPTSEECQVVHDLLLNTIEPDRRKRFFPPDDIPAPSEVVAGCGEVPSILDALIRTLLSAATNGRNSSNAFQGLVKRFGLATEGVGKGSVDWNAVHEASLKDVREAIECGGLGQSKSQNIKTLLAMVHKENQERLAALLKAKEANAPDDGDEEDKAEKELELRVLQKGILTLDYYHHLEKEDALTTFVKYPGIGVKTAACVNLFCMQRPCFAVDTHVFRMCQYLGWVPSNDTRTKGQKKTDRDTTFSHCEVRVPDHLKYGLHQLFLEHGKTCPRCRAVTGEKSQGWADANCVIEHLVKRLGAKKGGVDTPNKAKAKAKGKEAKGKEAKGKAAKGKKGKKGASSEDEVNDEEMSI